MRSIERALSPRITHSWRAQAMPLLLLGAVCTGTIADLSIVIVSSPARTHPCTDMLWRALGSTRMIGGLEDAPITIVLDGYRTPSDLDEGYAARIEQRLQRDPASLSKKGIVSADIGDAYERYKLQLRADVLERGLSSCLTFDEPDGHVGFAMCVRRGLLKCGSRFALVLQHDRCFIRQLRELDFKSVLAAFDDDTPGAPPLRYVGFPSSTSKRLATRLAPKYKLGHLLKSRTVELRPGLCLRRTIFWYDSNHLVDVARALQIYEPARHLPRWLQSHIGDEGVRRLTLRRGDFIEDRFGTEQRALLCGLAAEPERCRAAFDWCGSFILEEVVTSEQTAVAADEPPEHEQSAQKKGGGVSADGRTDSSADSSADFMPADLSHFCSLLDSRGRATMVAHIDARGAVPRGWYRDLPSLRGEDLRK